MIIHVQFILKILLNLNLILLKEMIQLYLLKAIKNKTEIKNMIDAHILDGAALNKIHLLDKEC